MVVLLLPLVLPWSALSPLAILKLPVVLLPIAAIPVAVLKVPVVLLKSAKVPVAVLLLPSVLLKSAKAPVAVLLLPVIMAVERLKPDGRVFFGRVFATGCETEERVVTLSGVLVGIASVRWWINRSSRGRERKTNERQ